MDDRPTMCYSIDPGRGSIEAASHTRTTREDPTSPRPGSLFAMRSTRIPIIPGPATHRIDLEDGPRCAVDGCEGPPVAVFVVAGATLRLLMLCETHAPKEGEPMPSELVPDYGRHSSTEYLQGDRDSLLTLGIPHDHLYRWSSMPAGIWRCNLDDARPYLLADKGTES